MRIEEEDGDSRGDKERIRKGKGRWWRWKEKEKDGDGGRSTKKKKSDGDGDIDSDSDSDSDRSMASNNDVRVLKPSFLRKEFFKKIGTNSHAKLMKYEHFLLPCQHVCLKDIFLLGFECSME